MFAYMAIDILIYIFYIWVCRFVRCAANTSFGKGSLFVFAARLDKVLEHKCFSYWCVIQWYSSIALGKFTGRLNPKSQT